MAGPLIAAAARIASSSLGRVAGSIAGSLMKPRENEQGQQRPVAATPALPTEPSIPQTIVRPQTASTASQPTISSASPVTPTTSIEQLMERVDQIYGLQMSMMQSQQQLAAEVARDKQRGELQRKEDDQEKRKDLMTRLLGQEKADIAKTSMLGSLLPIVALTITAIKDWWKESGIGGAVDSIRDMVTNISDWVSSFKLDWNRLIDPLMRFIGIKKDPDAPPEARRVSVVRGSMRVAQALTNPVGALTGVIQGAGRSIARAAGRVIAPPAAASTIQGQSGGGRISGAAGELLSFIAQGEGGYNSMNQGTVDDRIVGSTHDASTILGKNLTEMTIAEIMQHQQRERGDPMRIFAAGRYQIIPDTMPIALRDSGLSPSAIFDEGTQDRLGWALITGSKRPTLARYIRGQSDDEHGAMVEFAQEWASLPHPDTGNSVYGNGNRAHHSVEEVRAALQAARSGGAQVATVRQETPAAPRTAPAAAQQTRRMASTPSPVERQAAPPPRRAEAVRPAQPARQEQAPPPPRQQQPRQQPRPAPAPYRAPPPQEEPDDGGWLEERVLGIGRQARGVPRASGPELGDGMRFGLVPEWVMINTG